MLSYEGSPLGVIAYVDPSGAPVVFCVFANGGADAPIRTENREQLSLADWSRGGRGFLVIGRKPMEQIAAWAQTLEKQI
jgi:anti-sigma factor RsiW